MWSVQDNRHKCTLIMSPDEQFEAKRKAQEAELLRQKVSQLSEQDKQRVFQDGKQVVALQFR